MTAQKLKLVLLITATLFLALAVYNTISYSLEAIAGFRDPDYFYNLYAELIQYFAIPEEELRSILSYLPGYYVFLAVCSGIGAFFDIFYIQAFRRNFPVKRKQFIVLGVLGIVFSQIVPGIICIVLGARFGDKTDDSVIDAPTDTPS